MALRTASPSAPSQLATPSGTSMTWGTPAVQPTSTPTITGTSAVSERRVARTVRSKTSWTLRAMSWTQPVLPARCQAPPSPGPPWQTTTTRGTERSAPCRSSSMPSLSSLGVTATALRTPAMAPPRAAPTQSQVRAPAR